MAVSKSTYYGSGTVYEMELTDQITIPTTKEAIKTFVETNCTAANQIGYLKNGFQFELTTENLEDQSDLGEMKVSLITKENATASFALFNANGETISRLYPTAKTTAGVTVIGGLANATQAEHVIIFVGANKNADSEQTVAIMVGKNTSGFNINFNPDSVEPFACQYTITPYNTDGNLYVTADIAGLPTLPVP